MEFLLLDDRENLKLAIIRKLEQQYSFSERKDRLCKQLAISPYLLERNITEINADLQRFGLINEMEISEKNNEILLSQSLRISSSIIEEYYLKDSLEFNLLKTIFFHQFTSIKKYGEKHGMSRTVVYKIVDHIRKELGQYGIKLSKNLQLSGNEMAIRQYFTMLYYRIYKDSEELY
ncbi:helix-turn-helix domain-containing protein, partial [Enterococcus faecalis]|nr:helix-turn-helix domain-containing protein [Enterococcus faecalis]